jgi:hypothetical protein
MIISSKTIMWKIHFKASFRCSLLIWNWPVSNIKIYNWTYDRTVPRKLVFESEVSEWMFPQKKILTFHDEERRKLTVCISWQRFPGTWMPQPDGWGRAYCSRDKGSSIISIIGGVSIVRNLWRFKGTESRERIQKWIELGLN